MLYMSCDFFSTKIGNSVDLQNHNINLSRKVYRRNPFQKKCAFDYWLIQVALIIYFFKFTAPSMQKRKSSSIERVIGYRNNFISCVYMYVTVCVRNVNYRTNE